MDVIQEIFKAIHFDANIYLHSAFCAPWDVSSNSSEHSSFHVIAYGNCQLHTVDGTVQQLNAGDLVFFPRNTSHQLINPDLNEQVSTTLICGQLVFTQQNNPILEALPDVVHIKANEMDRCPGFKNLFHHIVNEAEGDASGRQLVLDKLAEVLFIYIIRHHIQTSSGKDTTRGLLCGLSHPQLAMALVAFHSQLDHPWTLAGLAEQAAMSRSKFATVFNERLGMTALAYMTHWRMEHARNLLSSGRQSVYQVALSAGYQSEAAFIKVFKKHSQMTPGQYRRHHQR